MMDANTDPVVADPPPADEGDMRHSYARSSAITTLHTALRHADAPTDADADARLVKRAEFFVDLALDLTRELVVLEVGNDDTARLLAAAVIAGNPEFPADYQPNAEDIAEGHRVIKRLLGS